MTAPTKPPALASLELKRISIDRDGYDHTGAYWGAGQPVYIVSTADAAHEITLRARNARTARRLAQRLLARQITARQGPS